MAKLLNVISAAGAQTTVRILLALVAGLVVGAALADSPAIDRIIAVAEPIGGLWLDALRMTIVPLVFSLLVVGVSSAAGTAAAGGTAARALAMFGVLLVASALFSALAVSGVLAAWPAPQAAAAGLREAAGHSIQKVPDFPTMGAWLRAFIPTNPIQAAAETSMAPLVVFALLFGLAVTRIRADLRTGLVSVFQAVMDTMLVLVQWVLFVAPIGVFALALIVGAKAGFGAAGALGHYIVILSGVCIAVGLLSYLLAVAAGVPLPAFARAAAPAQAVAFSTQSSIASLPAMIAGTRQLGAPESMIGVVLPLAVSLFRITSPAANLGVAIYCAHIYGVPLNAALLAAGIGVAAVISLASVGLPGQITFFTTTGPICLIMGVPLELLPILLAVETIPDIFRTVGNVTADMGVTCLAKRVTGAQS
ncbi:sodium:dicarboxylate symporter [Phenylobacterium sp. Root77]|uniref:dicarboxylate/amino acid:cation symporter n=1 Tax=unclassified Phenylobacterium TaxID=2640670 RepID=UPI0006FD65A6|nr:MULTISPECIES: cation:dicarboxylase symporter family transporter [unclassified Phenylobacterium]KQW71839.1 sodium:dicarboxylate symporter [Phenylobacterium sp. Root1277]KQW94759.1 sodium:dicarboxylate symporter [Phenylobacterium sp. Root1290]KRC44452.1 sodium:dicarboxylate symporter [Phenylobacterium sp. Root77]